MLTAAVITSVMITLFQKMITVFKFRFYYLKSYFVITVKWKIMTGKWGNPVENKTISQMELAIGAGVDWYSTPDFAMDYHN